MFLVNTTGLGTTGLVVYGVVDEGLSIVVTVDGVEQPLAMYENVDIGRSTFAATATSAQGLRAEVREAAGEVAATFDGSSAEAGSGAQWPAI